MVSFTSKKLAEKIGVAETLRKAREARHFSLDAVARALGVAKKFLEAIESDDYNSLPGELYTKNFIRNYADFLKIDGRRLVDAYLKERGPKAQSGLLPPQVCELKHWDMPRYASLGAAIFISIVVIYYLGMQIGGIFSAPPLVLENPAEGAVSNSPELEVAGQTAPESRVNINGVEKMSNTDGRFSEVINLTPGVNKIIITAVKKHGPTATVLRDVVYEEVGN
jgi:cytoskeletal protein RodZ